ncbi:MAG: amidohydrolase [Candidatus Cloacimonas sp.]|jgi:predicted amidohydrolase YtcJ|nr:amidohydrolase [Candidatus Cloacimonas sp.]
MDYIFANGYLLNPHTGTWEAQSLLMHAGKIVQLGELSSCRRAASHVYEVIDLNGKLLLPAFMDTHTHFVELAKSRMLVSLNACSSLDEMQRQLVHYRDNLPYPATWILGGAWDRNLLPNPLAFNRHFLDAIFPDKPVALMGKDYHSLLCNSMALKIIGITAQSTDPCGGRIERDAQGTPTGMLYETATALINPYVKMASESQIVQAIKDCMEDCYRLGLCGFHSLENIASHKLLLDSFSEEKPFRMVWHFQTDELETVAAEQQKTNTDNAFHKTWGMKIFGDGSLGSQTAAMFQSYPADSGNFGILRYSDAELFKLMQRAAEHGYPCSIHAIGNKSVFQVIQAALKLQKNKNHAHLIHRIEHVQSIRNVDIPLMKQAMLIAAMQPLHLAYDVPMIEKHWQDIQDQVYSFASLSKAGVPLAFGSDAPIESINPFLGIFCAIERRPHLSMNLPMFRPSEAISPLKAIQGYTLGAAAASQDEHLRGSLDPGKLADIVVIDDYRKEKPDFWLQASSHLTMINGTIVHSEL